MQPPRLNMAIILHTEVALTLVGHVISVYLAHRVALRLLPTRRKAMVSQLPMLALMVAYTVVGLWVISLLVRADVSVGRQGFAAQPGRWQGANRAHVSPNRRRARRGKSPTGAAPPDAP